VPPIAGGLARYVLNPVPLTVEDALNVVNAPVFAAVEPMAGGLAKVSVDTALLPGYVANTLVVLPANEINAVVPSELANTVVRVSVLGAVKVPSPVSHANSVAS